MARAFIYMYGMWDHLIVLYQDTSNFGPCVEIGLIWSNKTQVSDLGPSWPSCLKFLELPILALRYVYIENARNARYD